MAFTGPLEDRLLIRERINCYSDAVFRADEEAYLSCWAEDGVRIGQGTECRGKQAIREQWRTFWAILDRMAFFTEVGAIEVEGDTAKARSYCREIIALKDGRLWKVVGLYRDDLVRREGVWLFARREYELLLDENNVDA